MTIHVIFNAHIDPVWLWAWPRGADEFLATCRSACDRLDAHPDLFFSQGEAWGYRMVETLDSELFERIRAHVRSGRWEVVGGWWIQPDLNLPGGHGLKRQITLGKRYFTDRFGFFPRIAFNQDSFGHAACLPGMMRDAGQDAYVFMRPQEHEKRLPARLFRWTGQKGGEEVTAFRIARSYCTSRIELEHVRGATRGLPAGLAHTMCFVGMGDHGGGPTEEQIAWVREHRDAIEGWRVEFSTMRRFFDSIAGEVPRLPVVVGELQYHAVGCYSVHRPVKTGVRRAERALVDAERVLEDSTAGDPPERSLIEMAWEKVCFHHFHDTLAGTCIPSAYGQVHDQLAAAAATGDEIVNMTLRRRTVALPGDCRQRMVFLNASERVFEGYVECEPWLDWREWDSNWTLVDAEGRPIPYQVLPSEALAYGISRLLFRLSLRPDEMAVVAISREGRGMAVGNRVTVGRRRIANDLTFGVDVAGLEKMLLGKSGTVRLPRLELLEDRSDTWSHGVERYAGRFKGAAKWKGTTVIDRGPLMASVVREGVIGRSPLSAEWRVYAGEPFVELILRVHWMEKWRVLKLSVKLPARTPSRRDGIPGGSLVRKQCGAERPLRDAVLVETARGRVGVACPDVFALDGKADRLRLTLLRSPIMAHHVPHPAALPRFEIADQGPHVFRFRFAAGEGVTWEYLEDQAAGWQRPPVVADVTRGMGRG